MILEFRIGKIPVRIFPWFFLTTLFINYRLNAYELALWTAIVLASVLVHELGHAAAVLMYGLQPHVDIHGLGGTTSYAGGGSLSYAKRIVISLAGPVMGFVAGALIFALRSSAIWPRNGVGNFVYENLFFVNVGWGIFNLLPMLPLDGGSVMKSALDFFTRGRGERPARVVSMIGAVVLGAIGVLLSGWWVALLALLFVSTNWRAYKALT